jgi:uncharacterized protein (DUF1330 family)
MAVPEGPNPDGYLVANWTVADPEGFEAYFPAAHPTMIAAGGEIIVADYASDTRTPETGNVTLVIRFESKQAVRDWLNSPEYAAAKEIRIATTEGAIVSIVSEFDVPIKMQCDQVERPDDDPL